MSDDQQKTYSYRSSGMGWMKMAILSAVVIAVAAWAILFLTKTETVGDSGSSGETEPITILCAAGMKKAVYDARELYEKEFGLPVNLTYGSSGQLEGQLRIQKAGGITQADLYIPADSSFSERTRKDGLTAESIPLARFKVVLAVPEDMEQPPGSMEELLDSGMPFTYCDTKAGAGLKTFECLSKNGLWDRVEKSVKAVFPTVTEAANAIKTSDNVRAGFIWDSVARQFGLRVIELPELAGSEADISANVVASSANATRALHFARFLAAPDRGNAMFTRHHFNALPGDRWSDQPEIVVFAGGVNRDAVDETIRKFEIREGCRVQVQYAGCGTLVGAMQTGGSGLPNIFLTCDASYLTKVEDKFGDAANVSSTEIKILVRGGNPKNIHTLADLGNPELKIGTTDPELSTLGFLSWELFREFGVYDSIRQHRTVVVTTPTAHELIAQVQTHGKLDAALVYEANCQNLTGSFELVDIDHPLATAVQNIASSRENPFPQLSGRLIDAILSAESSQRFTSNGFTWLGGAQ